MRVTLFTLFTILFLNARAQQVSIKGIIVDSKNASLPGAAVILLNSDSSIITNAITTADGSFTLNTSVSGEKLLKVSFLGFNDLFRKVTLSGPVLNLGNISLTEKSEQLETVNVTQEKIPVQTKGDTVSYNADAFKVNRDATAEDLATKMPGISSQDGKIQAQGEDVKKVLIDGKPYLGDDPNAALKNLPAEVIDKIQVFDKKSDQAEFTGFDDGNTTKTINIVTRPQFRNGTFGKAYVGAGTEDLWKAGANVNSFKDKRKLTVLLNTNNINEQNFSTDDLLGVIGTNAGTGNRPGGGTAVYRGGGQGGGGGGGRYGPQNDASNFLVNQKNGIITTYSAGLNYVNTWGKLDFSGSYFYNQTQNNAETNLTRQYFTNTEFGLVYNEDNRGRNDNFNNRANLKFEYKFDSLNSILFQPRVSFQKNENILSLEGINSTPEGIVSVLKSGNVSNQNGYNLSGPILYRHSFAKKGRTISLNLTPSSNSSDGDANNFSTTTYNDTTAADTINQTVDNHTQGWGNITELTYTEPVKKSGQFSITYRNNYSESSAEKLTYSSDILDSSLSNKFKSKYMTNAPSVAYRVQKEKWNFMLGAGYQVASLKNDQTFPAEGNVDKTFNSVLPSAMFQYKFTLKKNLRVFYRSVNNAPSVTQLQNVVNNNNPLQLTTGNPNLSQDWQNFLNVRYSATNSDKNTSFFTFINFNYTQDYIGSSTIIAENDTTVNGTFVSEGNQLTIPVNLDQYYSTRFYTNYGFPVKLLKSNLNINASGSLSKTPSQINGEENESKYSTLGLGFALSSNISEKIDFLLSSNMSYNNVRNTLETNSNSKYYNFNSKFRVQVNVYKGIFLQTDISHQTNSGLSSAYNQNYFLWNASAAYKFLPKQEAELRLSVFDILEQNKSITRNTNDLYYEDVQSNVLSQYFMLTFTYNLKHFAGQK